jgi:hypothetical protein
MVREPLRADVNVATLMSRRLTVLAEYKLIVLRRVERQYTRTLPQVGQVVATIARRRATTPVRTSEAPLLDERRNVLR